MTDVLVLFDFGEVLGLPQTPQDRAVLARGVGVDAATFEERYWASRHAYDSGDLTDADYWAAIAGRALDEPTVQRLAGLDTESWLHLSPEVTALHAELVDHHVPTALFSNAPHVIADAIDGLPQLAGMRGRYFSARLRLAKPDPEAFLAVVADLGVRPADVVLVDDRQVNVDGAHRAGLAALRFTGPTTLRQDLATVLAGRPWPVSGWPTG